jgi:hypothetical protein
LARKEPGLVLPTLKEVQDDWEEVAGREQEPEAKEDPEAEEHAEEDPEAEEDPGAKEDAEAKEVYLTPQSPVATSNRQLPTTFTPFLVPKL